MQPFFLVVKVSSENVSRRGRVDKSIVKFSDKQSFCGGSVAK